MCSELLSVYCSSVGLNRALNGDMVGFQIYIVGELLHLGLGQWYQHSMTLFTVRIKCDLKRLIYASLMRKKGIESSVTTMFSEDVDNVEQLSKILLNLVVSCMKILMVCWMFVEEIGILSTALGFIPAVLTCIYIARRLGKRQKRLLRRLLMEKDDRLQMTKETFLSIYDVKVMDLQHFVSERITTFRQREIHSLQESFILKLSSMLTYYATPMIISIISFGTYSLQRGENLNTSTLFVLINLLTKIQFSFYVIPDSINSMNEFSISKHRIKSFLNDDIPNDNNPTQDSSWETINIRKDELFVIIGRTASGKTTLLKRWMDQVSNSESISYVSQNRTLYDGTIQENICFGLPFDKQWFLKVVKLCNLEEVMQWQHDQINQLKLSAGQKARINLARALYHNCDNIFLDDPFACLDENQAKDFFCKIILNHLKGKRIVFITNRIHHLFGNIRCGFLDQGKIVELGRFDKLKTDPDSRINQLLRKKSSSNLHELVTKQKKSHNNVSPMNMKRDSINFAPVPSTLHIMKAYLSMNPRLGIVATILTVLNFVINLQADFVLTSWSQDVGFHSYSSKTYILAFAVLKFIHQGFELMGGAVFFSFFLSLSSLLHERLLNVVLFAQSSWFRKISIGDLLTRFSVDTSECDSKLTWNFQQFLHSGISVLFSFSVLMYVLPKACFISCLFALLQYKIQRIYRSRRYVKVQQENLHQSRVLSHIVSTMQGLTTINAFKKQQMFQQQLENLLSKEINETKKRLMIDRIFTTLIKFISLVYTTLITYWVFSLEEKIRPIVLTHTFKIGNVSYVTFLLISVESGLLCAWRMMEYLRVPQENVHTKYLPNWPQNGSITFDNVSIESEKRETILNNISWRIRPNSSNIIVGQSGIGKSVLVQSCCGVGLVRSGKIYISDEEIQNINVLQLRKAIAYVGHPISFSLITIRDILNSKGQHPEEEIQKLINYLDHVSLDSMMNNVSEGQQRLIYLFRAILNRKSIKVLILDEVLDACDYETREAIEQLIKSKFSKKTVIYITHHGQTVTSTDSIVVLKRVKGECQLKVIGNPNSSTFANS